MMNYHSLKECRTMSTFIMIMAAVSSNLLNRQ